ncbi:hypothetical protein Svir_18300 [Saccharomonospora viridis DSM 43017]|uniref:Phosphodiesterase n=2 Tax=Saccharomonospora viridis TaxID=1852 RepID=C7MU74_SACVD|nr:hypothetical protein [Saccharomonospora viridis]ACU96853.1 hypothetical protein Svir_18300 [Saccharomonospora viridis DSM 43017]
MTPWMWTSAVGSVLGDVFGTIARFRHDKPLHPRGTVYDAVLRRTGSFEPWGVEWLDLPGEDHGVVRLSRSVGLPRPLPDVLGLAFTFNGPAGDRHDLLLATTGLRPGTRFALLPRRDPFAVPYSSLLPYRAPRGLVLLAAMPTAGAGFRLCAATPAGRWQGFATLELSGRTGSGPDRPIRFDPVLHPLPGLSWPPELARLREPAYAAARRTGHPAGN